MLGFGEFKNDVVTSEPVRALRFILFHRCIIVVIPFIVHVSPSLKPSFLFFQDVGTKNVVRFQLHVGEFCVTMVVFMYNDRFGFPNLLAVATSLLLLTIVGTIVLPIMSLLTPCTMLWSLYLLIPSLINPVKSEV